MLDQLAQEERREGAPPPLMGERDLADAGPSTGYGDRGGGKREAGQYLEGHQGTQGSDDGQLSQPEVSCSSDAVERSQVDAAVGAIRSRLGSRPRESRLPGRGSVSWTESTDNNDRVRSRPSK